MTDLESLLRQAQPHLSAHELAAAIAAIPDAPQARNAGTPQTRKPGVYFPPRRAVRSPDRAASVKRRRQWAGSSLLPPAWRGHFTEGERAALAVIGREAMRAGTCSLPIDAIAAAAGVHRSTVKRALRKAREAGLVSVEERRRFRQRSLTNVVRIALAWRAWLGSGVQAWNPTQERFSKGLGERSFRPPPPAPSAGHKLPGRRSRTAPETG